jgi:hypothetical protein
MEYLNHRGELADVPIAANSKTLREEYDFIELLGEGEDFDADVEQEVKREIGD